MLNDIFAARMIGRHSWYLVEGIIDVVHWATLHNKSFSHSLYEFQLSLWIFLQVKVQPPAIRV